MQNGTPSWSTCYLCSILHSLLVVLLMLTSKWLVSKVGRWIRWKYPTRMKGTDFRRMLPVTEDILTLFIEKWSSSKGIHMDGTFNFTCSFFSLFITLQNKFHEINLNNLYMSSKFSHIYYSHHNRVKSQGVYWTGIQGIPREASKTYLNDNKTVYWIQ